MFSCLLYAPFTVVSASVWRHHHISSSTHTAVAQLSGLGILFTNVIDKYASIRDGDVSKFLNIPMEITGENGDIIDFYNKLFVPNLAPAVEEMFSAKVCIVCKACCHFPLFGQQTPLGDRIGSISGADRATKIGGASSQDRLPRAALHD